MPSKIWVIAAGTSALMTVGSIAVAGAINGSATYRERIAVPPGATLYVELQDVSQADASAVVLAAQRYALSAVPADFEITYDDALIRDDMRYVVRGTIYQGRDMLFTTDTAYPVLTDGAGRSVDLLLVRADQDAMLENSDWFATVLQGAALETDKPPTISFATDGAFSGSGGCNRISGQADISGSQITFPDNMAATLMACPPALDEIERQFFGSLQSVTTYVLRGDTLTFLDATGQPLVQFARAQ